ncbi:MAG: mannose-6-phosphate isomerase, class I [Deferribacteres bacterium]|nr:mannose-6-phosphate isomerase, class I [Deferribacteres bacterium]
MKSTIAAKPYLMHNTVQNYAWGTRGETAFIPKLLGKKPEKGVPYAELWMGAHPKAPSEIEIDGERCGLDKLAALHSEAILGKMGAEKCAVFPFLFKVLSAGEPLSIQAHPNKIQAETLHARDARHYPDDNHKPEIAIAISPFTALAGFKSLTELSATFATYPEIAEFLGEAVVHKIYANKDESQEKQKLALKAMYSRFLQRSETHKQELTNAIDALVKRLQTKTGLSSADALFLEMRDQYSGADVGLFSIYLLNFMSLQPGEALFMQAGIPHAYIKGNIIECMANSDNVVRAGLTPKFQDKKTLMDILTYESGKVEILGDSNKEKKTIYKAPVEEFVLSRFHLETGDNAELKLGKPAIALLLNGTIKVNSTNGNEIFHRGQSIFFPACLHEATLVAQEDSLVFVATVP